MVNTPFPKKSKHLLSNYVQLKTGENMGTIAEKLQISYHSLIKVIQKLQYRENRQTRTALAEYLGVPYDVLWGPDSDLKIRQEVKKEIHRITIEYALKFQQDLREQVLGKED